MHEQLRGASSVLHRGASGWPWHTESGARDATQGVDVTGALAGKGRCHL